MLASMPKAAERGNALSSSDLDRNQAAKGINAWRKPPLPDEVVVDAEAEVAELV